MASLPPAPVVHELDAVEAFLRSDSCKTVSDSRVRVFFRRIYGPPNQSAGLVWHDRVAPAWSSAVRAARRARRRHDQGHVVDAKGKPVDGAKVTIEQTERQTRKFETKTDKKGEFIQIGLQSAGYKVTAEKDKLASRPRNTRVSQRATGRTCGSSSAAARGDDPTAAAKTAELQKAFDEGVAPSTRRQARRGDREVQQGARGQPQVPRLLQQHRLRYAQKKDYDKAEEAYKKAIEVKPDDAEAYNGLANIYNAQRKFDQAAAASAKANELTASAPGGAARRQRRRALQPGRHPLELRQDSPRRRRRSRRRSPPTRTTPRRTTSSAWRS